jgi:hypothetical protein
VPEKKAIEIQWLAGCSDGWASQEVQAVPDFVSASPAAYCWFSSMLFKARELSHP